VFSFLEKLSAAALTGTTIPASCFDSVGAPIARLLADQDDAGELLTKMRALSVAYGAPIGACPTYKGLYRCCGRNWAIPTDGTSPCPGQLFLGFFS